MKVRLAYGKQGLEVSVPDDATVVEPGFAPGLEDEAAAFREFLFGATTEQLERMGGLFRLPDTAPAEERETPALLWAAQRIEIDEEIAVPGGFRLIPPGEPPSAGTEGDFAFCRTEATVDGRKLRLRGTVQYQRRTVTVEEWPTFRAAVQAWRDLAALRLGGRREET